MTLHGRKPKRWLTAAIAGSAVAAGAFTFLPAMAQAQSAPTQQAGPQADFTKAAAAHGVPVSVLMGVTHEESDWQDHQGYSDKGGYGLGNLTDVTRDMLVNGAAGAGGRADVASVTDQPGMHTLRTAAALTGIPADRLKTDPEANLEGTAALLASYQKTLTGGLSKDPSDWAGPSPSTAGSRTRRPRPATSTTFSV
jgi:hypothetical protein